MAQVRLTYMQQPPDGGQDRLLSVSVSALGVRVTAQVAAEAIARQYPLAVSEMAPRGNWLVMNPETREVLATLEVTEE